MEALQTTSNGLTSSEAKKRLQQNGPNALREKKVNPVLKFLSYLWGPIPWMIEIAVILSALARHWPDFFIILTLLIANVLIGFLEERQANNAIQALKAKLAKQAKVRRDGKWTTLDAAALVTGDVIHIRLGDIVPADVTILNDTAIEVDQSALTGESLPVTHAKGEAVYSGSIIRQGETDALVTATGSLTYFGKTAKLVEEAHTVSHFQKAVLKIGNYLIVLALILVAFIVGIALLRGDKLLTTLQFALVLTVAAIPVAMPTVLSVTMAVGAKLLAKMKAIVSKLVSIEELAGMDILCTDKTGTLTQNNLTIGTPFTLNNNPDETILLAALASRQESNDTIDNAVIAAVKDKAALQDYTIKDFTPFDPVHKRTSATVTNKAGQVFRVCKGASQVIIAMTNLTATEKEAVDKTINEFAAKGYRSLGVARAAEKDQWKFVGILPMFDPPRADAKTTIATAFEMGVNVKMITGDAQAIARETAKELGMRENILDTSTLGSDGKNISPATIEAIEKADGFAQVFPEHKFEIISVLQNNGHNVGMTGDGVNDAPALKKADCGIAVSGATDAARAAASIVLMTPGLSVIIDAIKESRRIFQRMKSYTIYRISETIRILFFMTLSILVFNFYPVTAIMIVLLAILNDGAVISIAYDNVKYDNTPEKWKMKRILTLSTVLGIAGVIASFGLFFLAEKVYHIDRETIQSLIYLKLSVAGQLTIFVTRTEKSFWSIKPSKILVIAVIAAQIIATLVAVYGVMMAPIGWKMAGYVWAYALLWFFISDIIKQITYKYLDRRTKIITT